MARSLLPTPGKFVAAGCGDQRAGGTRYPDTPPRRQDRSQPPLRSMALAGTVGLVRLTSPVPPIDSPARLPVCPRFVLSFTRMWMILVLATLGLAGLPRATAHASSVVDLKSYASASGKYVLEIDPTELYGRGPGRYRLTMAGREAWSKTLPFTLYDAAVTNDGTTIGYAYDHDREGFAVKGGFDAGMGSLHVVVLDAKGAVRLDEVSKRKSSMMLHAPAEPVVTGIILQEDQDRFTIRTATEHEESWWAYRCSSGKPVLRFNLRKASAAPMSVQFVQAARPIRGTPLVLVHWSAYDAAKTPQSRSIFMLVTQDGRAVWSRDVSADYSAGGDEAAEDKLRAAIDKTGLISAGSEPGQFELWFVAEAQRVLFGVTRDEKLKEGWRIEEISRRPDQPPADEQTPPPIEKRPLPLLGSFKLESVAPTGPIHDIQSFEFDTEGRIGIIRRTPPAGEMFVLLDAAGEVLAEVPVPKSANDAEVGNVSAASVGSGKWVLVASEPKQEARSWGWWFDPAEKRLSKVFPLVCPDITGVAGTGDGGFVVLVKRHSRYSSVDEMHAFDRQGAHLWGLTERNDGDPGSLFSPEDVTVTTKGEVAVVDNIHQTVQLFGLDGKFRRAVELKKSWRREPNYPSEIMPDIHGGFIVHDFDGDPPFVRMKADGTVRGPLRPRHQDGRLVDTMAGLCVAPDGRIWACDQHALLRLDDDGVVDFTLGHDPRPDELDQIASVTGDRHGHLYAVDERTGAIHVFDADGRKLRTCKPAPGDFKENVRWPHLTVADDGSVYVGGDDRLTRKPGYLHFGPDGSRRGFEALKFNSDSSQAWEVQPGTGHFLVTEYQTAFLVGPKGDLLKKIDRRADRLWLDYISEASFASDGSLAIHSERSGVVGESPAVTLFARDGTPVRTFPLPSGQVSLLGYNGSHLVLRRGKAIEIYDSRGAAAQTFPAPEGNEWEIFLTREGRELWSVDFASRNVQRFAMP